MIWIWRIFKGVWIGFEELLGVFLFALFVTGIAALISFLKERRK